MKKELKDKGLKPYEQVEVEDPFTHEKKMISLDRTGHNEKSLIMALADPNLSRDRKDHALSMYLWERGAQSASLIADIMRYKGQYSKENQVFQARMRFDFEAFVNSFTNYLDNQAHLLGITLCIDIPKEKKEFEAWLKVGENAGKGYTYKDFYEITEKKHELWTETKLALVELALYAQDEADALKKAIQNIQVARMAMKGGGIYVDKQGKPYSVNDPALEDIIKAEKEIDKQAREDNGQ